MRSLNAQNDNVRKRLFPSASPTNGFVGLWIPSMSLFDPPCPVYLRPLLSVVGMTGLVGCKITQNYSNRFSLSSKKYLNGGIFLVLSIDLRQFGVFLGSRRVILVDKRYGTKLAQFISLVRRGQEERTSIIHHKPYCERPEI